MWQIADRDARRIPRARPGRVRQRLRGSVHAAGHRRSARRSRRGPRRAHRKCSGVAPHGSRLGSTDDKTLAHTADGVPLRGVFATYVEDRRREPRDDVLTGLGHRDVPGRLHSRRRRRRAGGDECVLRRPGNHRPPARHGAEGARRAARHPASAARRSQPASRTSSKRHCASRARSRATSGYRGCQSHWRQRTACRHHGDGAERRGQPRPAPLRGSGHLRPRSRKRPPHLAFGRGIHSCPGAPLARAETRVAIERLLDRTADIRISEEHHGPAGNRRYRYIPTFILRGLTELHLEFTLSGDDGR